MSFIPTHINIGGLILNNTGQSCTVSFGAAHKTNHNVCAKKTQGFGQQHADFCIRYDNIHMAADGDAADVLAGKTNK